MKRFLAVQPFGTQAYYSFPMSFLTSQNNCLPIFMYFYPFLFTEPDNGPTRTWKEMNRDEKRFFNGKKI